MTCILLSVNCTFFSLHALKSGLVPPTSCLSCFHSLEEHDSRKRS